MESKIEINYIPYEEEYLKKESEIEDKFQVIVVHLTSDSNVFKGICRSCRKDIRQDEDTNCCSHCGSYLIW